ncbi:MAG: YeeE/YedE thiosulfate transporter family protein [Imperialibacter sp.]|uniref:YeeE/YedE thiosulfate transporter family protein n=1 Tax=Imperialibacter sp. TaxID=2038411 RepID=UPI003A844CDB
MNGPFYEFGWIGEEASLAFALITGVAFGFFLERAGLGSAKKLAGQFYFRDMTVFKMMFTAIITAMLGVFWLSWAGLLQADMIYLTPTFVWPQLIGGLVFGVGFIVGGYCPGTSCVASSTGSLDGLVNVAGLLFGIFLFGELYPWLEDFYTAGPLGQVTMDDYFGIPEGIMVFLLVSMALAGFWASEQLEKKYSAQ